MIYYRELLDRSTGQLALVSIGDWIKVTELGERYGVGPRQVRAILHHMGLLQAEKGRYRLPRWAVEKGLGIRHDRPASARPFDVISPLGQQLVDEVWDATVADYQADLRAEAGIDEAKHALDAFKQSRPCPMTTQQEVCWLLDRDRDTPHETIAKILEVDRGLVSRYAKRRSNDKSYWQRWKQYAPRGFDQLFPPPPRDAYVLQPDEIADEEAVFRRVSM